MSNHFVLLYIHITLGFALYVYHCPQNFKMGVEGDSVELPLDIGAVCVSK